MWAERVAAWQRSRLSAAAFAARHGLSPRTLVWWRWRLATARPAATPVLTAPQLVAVDVEPATAATAWEVALAGGHVLRVHAGIAPDALRVVLDVLALRHRSRRR